MRSGSEKFLLTGLILLIAGIATAIFFSWQSADQLDKTAGRVSHTNDLLYHSERILALAIDNETGARGFAITGNEEFLDPLKKAEIEIKSRLLSLRKLTGNDPVLQSMIDSMENALAKRIEFSREMITARNVGGHTAVTELVNDGKGKMLTDNIRRFVAEFQFIENTTLREVQKVNEKKSKIFNLIAEGFGIFSLLLLIALSFRLRSYFLARKESHKKLEETNNDIQRQLHVKTVELNYAFERITDAFMSLDTKWCFTYMNRKAGEILGRDPASITGKNIWKEFPERLDQLSYAAYEKAMKEQKYIYQEQYHKSLDRWFENHIYPSPDGLSVFFRDITERKKASIEAENSRLFIESIVNSSPDTIYIYDIEEKRNIYVNNGIQTNLGYSDEEIKEMGNQLLPRLMHPDDFDNYLKNIFPRYAQIRDGELLAHEFRIHDKEGNWHWLSTKESVFLRNPDGSPRQIFGITNDVTERKTAEDKLRLSKDQLKRIFDTTYDVLYLLNVESDNDYRLLAANKSFYKNTGFSETDVIGKFDHEIIPPDKWVHLREKYQQVVKTKQAIQWENTGDFPSGKRTGIISISPVLNTSGECVQLVGSVHDITERKKAQAEIEERAMQLQMIGDNLPGTMVYRLIWEPDGKRKFIYVSKSAETILGFTPEEIIKYPELMHEITFEEDRHKVKMEEDTSYKNLSVFDAQVRYYHKSGELRWAHIRSVPRKMKDGSVIWDGIHTDITLQKQKEERIAEHEQQLRLFVEYTPAAIAMFDTNMNYIITSQRWLNDYKINESSIIGKSHYDIFPDIPERWKEIHRECLNGATIKSEEDMFVRADGRIDWVRWEIHPWLKQSGEVGGIIIFSEVITERKNAMQALKESEQRYDLAIMATKDGIWDWDIETNNEYFSPRWCEILGYDSNDPGFSYTYQFWADRIHPDHYDYVMNALKDHLEQRKPYYVEYLHRHKSGEYRWQSSIGESIFNADGKPVRMVGSIRDITEWKTAQEKLKESEEKYRSFFESSMDGILLASLDGNIFDANPAACAIFGMTQKQVCAAGRKGLVDMNDPGLGRLTKERAEKGRATGEITLIRKNGEKFSSEVSTSVFSNGKNNMLSNIIIRDITDRKRAEQQLKESEEKYRTLFEQAADALFIIDKEGRLLDYNPAACNMLGYTGEEFKEMNLAGICLPEELAIRPFRFKELYSGKSIRTERVMVHKQQQLINVEMSCKLLPDGRILTSTRDITERKRTEKKLAESERKLRQVVASSTDSFYVIDRDYRVILINEIASSNLEIAWGHPVNIGTSIWDLLPDENDEPVRKSLEKVFAGERVEYELNLTDSRFSPWYTILYIPVYDEEGVLVGAHISARDISERKKIEQEVKNSEERYRTLIERVSDGFIALDKNWNYTYANKKIGELVHRDPDSLIGKNVWEEFPDAVGSATYNSFVKAFNEQRYICNVDYFEPLDLWQENHIYPSSDGISVFIRDITQQKRAERALKEVEVLNESIFTSMTSHIAVVDQAGTIISVNKAWEDFFVANSDPELENKTGVGSNYFTVCHKAIAEGDTIASEVAEGLSKVIKHEIPTFEIEYPCHSPEVERWFLLRVTPFADKSSRAVMVHIDISQRKRAEIASRQNLEIQQLIMQSALDAIVCMNMEGDITVWTVQAEKIFGWKEQEVLGKKMAEILVPPAYREMHYKGLKNYTETGKGRIVGRLVEVNALNKAGHEFPVEIMIVPLKQDNRMFFCSFIRDITERKNAQEEILKANERFNLIAHATNDFVWDSYLDENKVWWNDNYYAQLGWKKGEEAPRRDTWEEHIHSADKKRVLDGIKKVMDKPGENIWTDEYRFAKADGSYITVLDRGYIMRDEKGKANRIIGAMTDISGIKHTENELRLSEEKYRMLFNRNPLPMWVLDLSTFKFLAVNESAINHYGYSAEEFSKLTALDIRPEEEKTRFIKGANTNNSTLYNAGVWKHLKKNGELISVEIFAYPLTYEGRKAELILVNDITEKLKAENLLKKSYENIRRLATHIEQVREGERINIAREIHDELGQQLTVLKMGISWLNKRIKTTDEKVIEKIQDILSVIDSTVKSVRRISSELRPSVLDDLGLSAALEWQAEEFEKRAGVKTVLKININDVILASDISTTLFRLFQESLTNIARHANASLVNIELWTAEGFLFFTIEDNGRGFDIRSIENKETLGILGMRERVSILKGDYRIISKPGEGVRTEIKIPLSEQVN